MCVKWFLVLVMVLDWTQCLPQGDPPAMLRGRMTGFPKNWGPGPSERQDKVDTNCTVPIDCGTPTPPSQESNLMLSCHFQNPNTVKVYIINQTYFLTIPFN